MKNLLILVESLTAISLRFDLAALYGGDRRGHVLRDDHRGAVRMRGIGSSGDALLSYQRDRDV